MAEYKRRLMRCRTRENGPISLSAKAVLAHCWSYATTDDVKAYYAGQRGRPRILLHHGLGGFARELDITVKQLRRHLTVLDREVLIMWPGGDWYELINENERERLLRLDPEVARPVNGAEADLRDRSVPVSADRNVPGSGHICPEDGTHLSLDRDTSVPRSLVGSDRDPVGIGSGKRPRAGGQREPSEKTSYREIALEIVLLAPQPPGVPALPATEDGIRHLVTLLVNGWPRDQVVAVLQAAPAIIAARPAKGEHYGPEMFVGERWTKWRYDTEQLKASRPALQLVTPEAAVEPDPEVDAEAQRRADEERLRRRVLAELKSPPVPNEFDKASWRLHPRWRAALMFAPEEAQRAARQVIDHAQAEGRDVTLFELTRALNAIEFADPSLGPDVIDQLRAARLRAESEGRTLTFDELAAIGRGEGT